MAQPTIKNKRFYLFNETEYILNANAGDETPNNTAYQYDTRYYSAVWEYSGASPRKDGTTDDVDIFYGLMRKNSLRYSANLNMLKTNDANTYVDVSTINIVTDSNSIGTGIFTYGDYTYNLTNSSSFSNSYTYNPSTPVTGTIIFNPNRSFYGKIIITYKTYDVSNVRSNTETLTLYILPYSYLRITKVSEIDTDATNEPTFINNISDPAYTYTLSESNPKNIIVRISNSRNNTDSINSFSSTNTGSTKITNYINSLIKGTINNIEILWTKIDTIDTLDTYFTTDFFSTIKINWTSTQTFVLILTNPSIIGTFNTSLRLTTNTTNINGNSRLIYANLTFIVREQEFIGNISYNSGECDDEFVQQDALGCVTTYSFNGVPLNKMVKLTGLPHGSTNLNVDLTDITQFKFATLVVVANATQTIANIHIQNSGTGIENNTIYVSSDNISLLNPGKKMVFMRVLFDPVIWEPSEEFPLV